MVGAPWVLVGWNMFKFKKNESVELPTLVKPIREKKQPHHLFGGCRLFSNDGRIVFPICILRFEKTAGKGDYDKSCNECLHEITE